MGTEAQKGLAICPKPHSCRVQGTEWQEASSVIQRLMLYYFTVFPTIFLTARASTTGRDPKQGQLTFMPAL